MGKIAFLFSGQGAQYPGMGQELFNNFESAKKVFEDASSSLNLDMKELCFEGPADRLNLTEYTQPAVVTVSLAAHSVVKEHGITPDYMAGFSLGEYSAYAAAGVFDIATVIPLVQSRGRYMQEAVPEGVGTMAAILGLQKDDVDEVCRQASEYGIVAGANYNCPGQIVIGGETAAITKATEIALQMGALKATLLHVSAPFHTSMLEPASKRLAVDLEQVILGDMNVPLISNVTADIIEKSQIKELLEKQVMNPVRWEESIRRLILEGVDTFIELGPGKTLSSFVRKIDRSMTVCNIEDMKSLEKTLGKLK